MPLLMLALFVWARARRRARGKEVLAGLALVALGLGGVMGAGPLHPRAILVSGLSILAMAAFACAVLWHSRERGPEGGGGVVLRR